MVSLLLLSLAFGSPCVVLDQKGEELRTWTDTIRMRWVKPKRVEVSGVLSEKELIDLADGEWHWRGPRDMRFRWHHESDSPSEHIGVDVEIAGEEVLGEWTATLPLRTEVALDDNITLRVATVKASATGGFDIAMTIVDGDETHERVQGYWMRRSNPSAGDRDPASVGPIWWYEDLRFEMVQFEGDTLDVMVQRRPMAPVCTDTEGTDAALVERHRTEIASIMEQAGTARAAKGCGKAMRDLKKRLKPLQDSPSPRVQAAAEDVMGMACLSCSANAEYACEMVDVILAEPACPEAGCPLGP